MSLIVQAHNRKLEICLEAQSCKPPPLEAFYIYRERQRHIHTHHRYKEVNIVANDNAMNRELTLLFVETLSYNHFLVYFIFYIKKHFYQELKLWHGGEEAIKEYEYPHQFNSDQRFRWSKKWLLQNLVWATASLKRIDVPSIHIFEFDR